MDNDVGEYELFMKMLEIIELKHKTKLGPPSEAEKKQIITIIERVEGGLFLNQEQEGTEVKIEGDRFENISNSVIATRQSIASGIIKVKEGGDTEIADALKVLEKAIGDADTQSISVTDKEKALSLLDQLTQQASSPNKVKVVLETLGKGLWEMIKTAGSVGKVAISVWPIVEKLWK